MEEAKLVAADHSGGPSARIAERNREATSMREVSATTSKQERRDGVGFRIARTLAW